MNWTTRVGFSLAVVAIAYSGFGTQSIVAATRGSISREQLKKQIAEAHTPEQYGRLATYFRNKEKAFDVKAAEEKTEWERRKQATILLSTKYPSSIDSAHNLYDYYSNRASEMGRLASDYERRMTLNPATSK
jgi:hypothetical protein